MTQTTDWDALIALRERGQRTAQEAVAADRRAAMGTAADTVRAATARERCMAERESHLQQLRSQVQGGLCVVAALRHAGDYIGVIDTRIDEATARWLAAQDRHAQACDTLQRSKERLRSATAALRAVQEMRLRQRHALASASDRRAEENADDAARQRWFTTRAQRSREALS